MHVYDYTEVFQNKWRIAVKLAGNKTREYDFMIS